MLSMDYFFEVELMDIEECVQEGDVLGGIDIYSLVCLMLCVSFFLFQLRVCIVMNMFKIYC